MQSVSLFAVAVVVLAALANATTLTCTCTSSASSSSSCNNFATQCSNLRTSSSTTATTSCTAGFTGATCTLSGSGSCLDSTTGATTCGAVCSWATFTTGATYYCSESSSSCFPANATVQLEDGTTKAMSVLQIGDKVKVAADSFSDVYMFSHRLSATRSQFVRIVAGGHTLELTPNHYLYVNNKLAVASTVKVGDKVKGEDGSAIAVESVSTVMADGLYNPHTMNGDIVVDGILTSTYTSDINPSLAHAMLWPVRMLHTMGVNIHGDTFAEGSELLASIMPDGKTRY